MIIGVCVHLHVASVQGHHAIVELLETQYKVVHFTNLHVIYRVIAMCIGNHPGRKIHKFHESGRIREYFLVNFLLDFCNL